jgi:hypothetical protein
VGRVLGRPLENVCAETSFSKLLLLHGNSGQYGEEYPEQSHSDNINPHLRSFVAEGTIKVIGSFDIIQAGLGTSQSADLVLEVAIPGPVWHQIRDIATKPKTPHFIGHECLERVCERISTRDALMVSSVSLAQA